MAGHRQFLLLACALFAGVPRAAWGAPALKPNATVIMGGEWIRLYFTGVPHEHRSAECWLGLFIADSPTPTLTDMNEKSEWTAPYTNPAPIKFINCDTADQGGKFISTGDGFHDFRILNYRQPVKFWMFFSPRSTRGEPKPTVQSPHISFSNQEEPWQGHLARTQDPSEMMLTWSGMSTSGNNLTYWEVQYGTSPSSLTSMEKLTSHRTYSKKEMCGEPAIDSGFIDPGMFYTAIMTGLSPNTKYYYRFGNLGSGLWSSTESFVATPPTDPHQRQRVLLTADVGMSEPDGTKYHWDEPSAHYTKSGLLSILNTSASDILFHPGDISYATGYLPKWDAFMHSIEPLSRRVPYMTGMGNHERDWPGSGNAIGNTDSGGECGVTTLARFPMPTADQKTYWYSVDHGNIHFVMIDTELEVKKDSPQHKWLEADLKAAYANRKDVPWVIVLGHRPIYWSIIYEIRYAAIEALFYKYKVDLCLWGHVHAAEATHPVYEGFRRHAKQPGDYDAPRHVVLGNGGQPLTHLEGIKDGWVEWLPDPQFHGWNEAIAHNATHLTFNFFKNKENTLQHTFTIFRNYPRNY